MGVSIFSNLPISENLVRCVTCFTVRGLRTLAGKLLI
jgi:hypothetical protein